jgi:hypothetical protein
MRDHGDSIVDATLPAAAISDNKNGLNESGKQALKLRMMLRLYIKSFVSLCAGLLNAVNTFS